MVQWLRLHTSNAGVQVQSLDGELRSHMLCCLPTPTNPINQTKAKQKHNVADIRSMDFGAKNSIVESAFQPSLICVWLDFSPSFHNWSVSLWLWVLYFHVLCIVTQSCPTLCEPMDCSPPSSSNHGESPGKNTGVGGRSFSRESS